MLIRVLVVKAAIVRIVASSSCRWCAHTLWKCGAMGTGATVLFQLVAGISINTAKTLRVFPSGFLRACAYSSFRSLLQFEKTLQEPGGRKQAESPMRKTPGENQGEG